MQLLEISDLAIDKNTSYVAVGNYYGLYLLKGKEYKGMVRPVYLPKKRENAEVIIGKPPLLWILNCSDRLKHVQLTENGSLLAVTEGWIHYVSSRGKIVWSKSMGPPLKALATPNGEYVVASTLDRVSFLDSSGRELWKIYVESEVKALALLKEEIAVVTQSKIYLISSKGRVEHTVELPPPEEKKIPGVIVYAGTPRIVAKANPSGDAVAVSYEKNLILVSAEGKVLLSVKLNTPIIDLSLTNTKLILGLGNGTITAMSLEGEVLWSKNLSIPIINVEASMNGNYIVANNKLGGIYLLRGDGKLLWSSESQLNGFFTGAIVSEDGKVAAVGGHYIVVFDRNGKVVWKAELPEGELKNPLAVISPLSSTPDLKYIAAVTPQNTVYYYKVGAIERATKQIQTPTAITPGIPGFDVFLASMAIAGAIALRKLI